METAAPWVAGLLLACPVLIAFYPPMTDLPFHEAGIGALRHLGDATMFPPGLYRRNLGEPNQLFHLAGWALSYLVSTRWAAKLVVAASVVAIPVCAARFARHAGTSRLSAIVVGPIALGWLFSWGLVANLIGLAALLAALPALDRLGDRPTPSRAVAALAFVPVLYLAHEAMMFAYAGAGLLLAALRPLRPVRGVAWRLTPFVACVAATAGEAVWQRSLRTPTVRGIGTSWDPLRLRLANIPSLLLPGDGVVRISMFLLCVLALVLFLWLRSQERATPTDRAPGATTPVGLARRWALAHRWELFAAAALAAYLAFPTTLYGATYVHQRWFAPAFAVFAVVAAPRDLWARPARIARFTVLALAVAPLLAAWPAFDDSSRQHAAVDELLTHIEAGSAVAELELGPDDPSRTFKLGTAYGRALATRGGRLVYSFTDSPIFPVVIPRRYQWNEAAVRIAFDCWRLQPAHDLRRYRYVLVHSGDAALAYVAQLALGPEAQLVAESGEWTLYESRLPVVPLLSPDVPLDDPPAPTFRDRLKAVIASAHVAGRPAPPPPDEPEPILGP